LLLNKLKLYKQLLLITGYSLQILQDSFLDSERSEEVSDFTMVFIFLLLFLIFLYPVYKISTGRSILISTYSTLYFRKLDQNGTLER